MSEANTSLANVESAVSLGTKAETNGQSAHGLLLADAMDGTQTYSLADAEDNLTNLFDELIANGELNSTQVESLKQQIAADGLLQPNQTTDTNTQIEQNNSTSVDTNADAAQTTPDTQTDTDTKTNTDTEKDDSDQKNGGGGGNNSGSGGLGSMLRMLAPIGMFAAMMGMMSRGGGGMGSLFGIMGMGMMLSRMMGGMGGGGGGGLFSAGQNGCNSANSTNNPYWSNGYGNFGSSSSAAETNYYNNSMNYYS